MLRQRLHAAFVIAVLGILLSGCASQPGGSMVRNAPENATASELSEFFTDCDMSDAGDTIGWVNIISSVGEWLHVAELDANDRPRAEGMEVTEVGVTTVDGRKTRIWLAPQSWPGIEWALENGGDVWIALVDPEFMKTGTVNYTLILTESGEAFFTGRCPNVTLFNPLSEYLGVEMNEVLRGLPNVEIPKIREYLGIVEEGEREREAGNYSLNPDAVDAEVLEPLTLIGVSIRITDPVQPESFSICSRIELGWNDCIPLDQNSVDIGYDVNGYVDDDGVLQFWLLDYDATSSQPYGKLGQVRTDGKDVSVVIDTSTVTADGSFTGDDLVSLTD